MCVLRGEGGEWGVEMRGGGWRGEGDRGKEEDIVLVIILDEEHLP